MNETISIVIPAYNEAGNIETLVNKIDAVFAKLCPFEIIFVDDGSSDSTLDEIKSVAVYDQRVKYISLSRNFGHQIALKAGIDHADGACVLSMDADLEHPPHVIPEMIKQWKNGFDIVTTARLQHENIGLFKRFTSSAFYSLFNWTTNVELKDGSADFRLLDQKVVAAFRKFHEADPFIRGLISWMGFRQKTITYEQGLRQVGVSKYNLKRMIAFSLTGITSFSVKPLQLSTFIGLFLSAVSFAYGLYALSIKLFSDQAVDGWTSLIASVLFIGGIQLIMIGIIGLYLGKVFLQIKQRPHYLVQETNLDHSPSWSSDVSA